MSIMHDVTRDSFMLNGSFAKKGYDWWWHSFTAVSEKDGSERPFFIEFFTVNPALGKDEVKYGRLGDKPSYLMVKAGTWGKNKAQLHRFFPWSSVRIKKTAPFEIEASDCFCSEVALRGSVNVTENRPEYMCDTGEITWDLRVKKVIAWNVGYGASAFLRAIKAFEMYWHAEGMKTEYSGTITYNGERFKVTPETCYGYSDKNWGRGFTSPWVWLSSNELTSNITGKKLSRSVFDIGGGRPKVYFVPLDRKLLSSFYYEGEEYEFNFSKFWTFSHTEFDCKESETQIIWHVKQWTPKKMMDVNITCEKKDMLFVNYEDPLGQKRHNRLFNGGNGIGNIKLYKKKDGKWDLIDDIKATHIGCEYGEYDK